MTALLTVLIAITASPEANGTHLEIDPRIKQATVQLSVRDKRGLVFASGTIVSINGTQGIIVTCGHTYKFTEPGTPINVTLFPNAGKKHVTGRLVSYDLKSDVGLVLVEGIRDVTPIPLAPPDYQPRVGEQVVVAGCDNAHPPKSEITRICALNDYDGPANIEVRAMPPDGRSGGGLFSARTELIGVCGGRVPSDRQGMYAALSCVYDQLSANQLALHSNNGTSIVTSRATQQTDRLRELPLTPVSLLHLSQKSRHNRAPRTDTSLERIDRSPKATTPKSQPTITATSSISPDTEVICILRPRNAPSSESKVIILNSVSKEFLDSLEKEQSQNP